MALVSSFFLADSWLSGLFPRLYELSTTLDPQTCGVSRYVTQEKLREKRDAGEHEKIVAKALDGQRYPLPLCEHMWVSDGERGSGPKGANDLCSVVLRI